MSYKAYSALVRPSVEVIIEEQDGAFSAFVPGVPGVYTTGRSREEIERNIVDALETSFEFTAEQEKPVIEAEIAKLRARTA